MSSKGRFTASVGSVQRGKRIALILRVFLAIVMLIFALFPILWIISASFNPTGSLVGQPLIPSNPTLANYERLFNNPYRAAARGVIDDVIEARRTRPLLIRSLELLKTKHETRPVRKHGNIPL